MREFVITVIVITEFDCNCIELLLLVFIRNVSVGRLRVLCPEYQVDAELSNVSSLMRKKAEIYQTSGTFHSKI